jgi:hypothetical protein
MKRLPEFWQGWGGSGARLDVLGSVRATHCPTCARPLAWVTAAHLRAIKVAWRCAPGAQPSSFELECASCRAFVIVIVAHSGVSFEVGDNARRLHQQTQEQHRQDIAERYDRDG